MKLEFFNRSPADQALIIRETASRRGLSPVMVEKDFWVSWTLAVLFAHPEFHDHLVFKGGTSLSKVFNAIARFSEDIDLSVSPAFLGITEESLEEAGSRNKRTQRMQELETACIERVRDRFTPELDHIAREVFGQRSGGKALMEFQVDATTHSPVILFHYPSNEPSGFDYLSRFVKMEFGSLTDQRPAAKHAIQPWLKEEFPKLFADFDCKLVALELGRTFWEKVTILHAEYHRHRDQPIRDRYSRHYSDMAKLSRNDIAQSAIARNDLRQRVVDWKSRFFGAAWARYDLAMPGTFRLAPPDFRIAELKKDYEAMRDYFLVPPPSFENVIKTISDLEHHINR
ncbi:MAG TPA: nucleotidyl transferase AbiEii/AbiGii toxin family protein [Pyrinomonadaceae bacterium]|nr:nucleotidyl transferase AbiEii/AbiGii toxin family protein [Pyrinomonadaceae bacterium]